MPDHTLASIGWTKHSVPTGLNGGVKRRTQSVRDKLSLGPHVDQSRLEGIRLLNIVPEPDDESIPIGIRGRAGSVARMQRSAIRDYSLTLFNKIYPESFETLNSRIPFHSICACGNFYSLARITQEA